MKDSTLFNIERQQKILELMRRDGSVNVNALAKHFGVTQATIRADLNHLEIEGALLRTHGGAIAKTTTSHEPKMSERHNEDKKHKIAQKAVDFVSEGDIILLDTGTTMVSFAKALVNSSIKELTVFSNDIDVIRILEEKENFSLHLLAGKMRNGYHYCYGSQVYETLANCHFNKMFLSSSAMSLHHGLTTANPELALMKRKMISASDETILLIDSSKLHHVDFQKFADISQMNTIIINNELSDEDRVAIENCAKKLILA